MERKEKPNWVRTSDAERILGVNRRTLKRAYAHPDNGFLKEGVHWKRGMYFNSSVTWNVTACKQALLKQGYVFTSL